MAVRSRTDSITPHIDRRMADIKARSEGKLRSALAAVNRVSQTLTDTLIALSDDPTGSPSI